MWVLGVCRMEDEAWNVLGCLATGGRCAVRDEWLSLYVVAAGLLDIEILYGHQREDIHTSSSQAFHCQHIDALIKRRYRHDLQAASLPTLT
jgi:hypothetical protein